MASAALTWMTGLLAAAALGVAGCQRTAPTMSGGAPPPVPVSPVALPASATDEVVATVDGRPIYASCVATQARPGVDARAALDECIAFDLLAAAAAAARVDADPEVQHDLRRTLGSALVAREFEAKIRGPADLPPEMLARSVAAARTKLVWPEFREALYVRAVVAPGSGLTDAQAQALATAVYQALPATHGLQAAELFDTATRVGAAQVPTVRVGDAAARGTPPWGLELERRPYRTPDDGRTELAFRRAMFALPGIGDVSPPTRTSYGWDLVLLTDLAPASSVPDDEIAAKVFPELRQTLFNRWLVDLVRDRYPVTVDLTPLEQIEQLTQEAAGSGAPPTPESRR